MFAMVISSVLSALANRRTANALETLTHDEKIAGQILRNGFVGMSKALREDPEAASEFFGMISESGKVVLSESIKRLKEDPQAASEFFSLVYECGKVVFQNSKEVVVDDIKKKIAKEIPVPKKVRWLYNLVKGSGNDNQPAQAANKAGSKLLPL